MHSLCRITIAMRSARRWIAFLKDRALAAELGANTGATVLVNFEWRQICAKTECIYDRLLAMPTEVASTQNQPALFGTRELTR